MRISRRGAIVAGAVAAVAGGAAVLLPRDQGQGGHPPYFARLQAALKRAGIAEPTLVIDRQRLEANIAVVRQALAGTPLALRVVTKSLQAPRLLESVMIGCQTKRLMVFNSVMLQAILDQIPAAEVLLGRPLPGVLVDDFVRRHGDDATPAAQPQWLVDSPSRLAEYLAIVRARQTPVNLNLEIDVGLHRGGLPDARAVAEMIELAKAEPLATVTGLMGYDAQVAGVPFPKAELARVKRQYAAANDVLVAKLGHDPSRTLNTAGSPTYRLHLDDKVANELAIGSAFVKPLDFDRPTLTAHLPAAFIAEPVLKRMDQALIPTLEPLAGALDVLDPNSRRGFFAYGYGDAEPVSPPGLKFSPLYGERAMLTGSARVALNQDDFIFFRPKESEGTFLQYGDLAVYDGGEIVGRWPTFPVAA
ncbi:alanine racemase [Phenylobacterium montanum]|uniref:Alanine racemase n=1 Tax=Phenylobacterium montanum TaxID=2823693 RepID=A0A975G2Q0_9CAUL|nr:alanine racemase [Caulobacter sp. S6]QUD89453.1 alanine racemase [Caulobacter sp. S6]